MLWKITAFGHFRPTPGGRKCQKTYLHTNTFHLDLFTCLYDHPLLRYSLGKLMFRKTTVLGSFGHIRQTAGNPMWPKLPKGTSTRQDRSFALTPKSIRPSVTKKQHEKAHVSNNHCFRSFWPNSAMSVRYKDTAWIRIDERRTDGRTDIPNL